MTIWKHFFKQLFKKCWQRAQFDFAEFLFQHKNSFFSKSRILYFCSLDWFAKMAILKSESGLPKSVRIACSVAIFCEKTRPSLWEVKRGPYPHPRDMHNCTLQQARKYPDARIVIMWCGLPENMHLLNMSLAMKYAWSSLFSWQGTIWFRSVSFSTQKKFLFQVCLGHYFYFLDCFEKMAIPKS